MHFSNEICNRYSYTSSEDPNKTEILDLKDISVDKQQEYYMAMARQSTLDIKMKKQKNDIFSESSN